MDPSSMVFSWTPPLGLFRGRLSMVLQLFFLPLPAYKDFTASLCHFFFLNNFPLISLYSLRHFIMNHFRY